MKKLNAFTVAKLVLFMLITLACLVSAYASIWIITDVLVGMYNGLDKSPMTKVKCELPIVVAFGIILLLSIVSGISAGLWLLRRSQTVEL